MTAPVRVTGLHHVTLVTRNMDDMIKFFEEIVGLGLVKSDVNLDSPDQSHYFFGDEEGNPSSLVTFFEIPEAGDNHLGAGGMHHVAIGVKEESDLHRQIQRLDAKGIEHSGIVDRHYWKALYFRGPHGLLVEFATQGPPIRAFERN